MITFRLAPHSIRPNVDIIELWYENRMIGQITPGDKLSLLQHVGRGPSLRILSKYPLHVEVVAEERAVPVTILEVEIG